MVQNGHGVGCAAELGAAVGHTGDGAGFHGQSHLVGDALLSADVGDLLGSAGAQVHDGVLRQLHSGPAGDDLLGVHGDGGDIVHGDAELTGESSVIGHAQALVVVLGRAHDDGIHIDAGDLHQAGVQGAALDDLLHLNNDDTAGVLGGLALGGDIQRTDLAVDGAVAVFIGVGAADQAHIDGDGLVEQALLTVNVHQLHQVFLGALVELAALVTGVYEGVQANVGDGADVVGGDVAVHVGDDALRQVIGLQLVGQSQLAQLSGAVPVTADYPLAHTLVAEVVAAGAVPVALTSCKEQSQVAGMAGFHKTVFQSLGQRLGAGAANEAAGGDGVTVLDHQGRFLSGDNAYFLHILNPLFK